MLSGLQVLETRSNYFPIYFGLSIVYFNHVEIIFPKKFSALSPEDSQLKNNWFIFFVNRFTVLEVHVKWFLNELLVSLIMPLLSSKSVDEKNKQFFF
jgi:hypothetical protein